MPALTWTRWNVSERGIGGLWNPIITFAFPKFVARDVVGGDFVQRAQSLCVFAERASNATVIKPYAIPCFLGTLFLSVAWGSLPPPSLISSVRFVDRV